MLLWQDMSLPLAARFRAIITGPLNATTPGIPDLLQDDNEVYGGPKVHSGSTKRKREPNASNPSSTRKVARRPSDDEGGTGREVSLHSLWCLDCYLTSQSMNSGQLPFVTEMSSCRL